MEDLINEQPEQDIEHCATCIHAADSEDICILRKCKYAIAELKDCYKPEQRWIPCSERLPEDYEDVLVWYEYFRYSGYNRIAQTWDVGYYISEFNRWGGGVTGQKVRAIAWMPLPEPYKGDEQG